MSSPRTEGETRSDKKRFYYWDNITPKRVEAVDIFLSRTPQYVKKVLEGVPGEDNFRRVIFIRDRNTPEESLSQMSIRELLDGTFSISCDPTTFRILQDVLGPADEIY